MKRYLFILPCFGAMFLLFACGGPEKKEAEKRKQDSLQAAEKLARQLEEKKKNIYLIEPPDTTYTGDYVDKYENGNTKFKGFFRFGKRHGQWLAFYPNGILWSECFYHQGLRQGANNVFYESGSPRYKGWYKNDQRDSLWTFYNTDGKVERQVQFRNDEEIK